MNLRDMLNMVRGGQDDRICVIKGTVSINDEGINKMLYDGKYWIRVKGTGEIIPPIPEELMNAEAGMGLGNCSQNFQFVEQIKDPGLSAWVFTSTKNCTSFIFTGVFPFICCQN